MSRAKIREEINELWDYLDIKDRIVLGFLVTMMVVSIVLTNLVRTNIGDMGINPIWALTLASLFFVYLQVRNQQSGSYPDYAKIIPHFHDDGNGGPEEFGLKNFGGPGLYLRVYARVKTEDRAFEDYIIRSHETVHLDGGEFKSVHNSEFTDSDSGECKSLLDLCSNLDDDSQQREIELFYTFKSVSGRGHPPELSNPTKMPMDDVVTKYDSKDDREPRTVRLNEIRNRVLADR